MRKKTLYILSAGAGLERPGADAEADWKLVCEGCYQQAFARNRFVSWVEGSDDRAVRDGGSDIQ